MLSASVEFYRPPPLGWGVHSKLPRPPPLLLKVLSPSVALDSPPPATPLHFADALCLSRVGAPHLHSPGALCICAFTGTLSLTFIGGDCAPFLQMFCASAQETARLLPSPLSGQQLTPTMLKIRFGHEFS